VKLLDWQMASFKMPRLHGWIWLDLNRWPACHAI